MVQPGELNCNPATHLGNSRTLFVLERSFLGMVLMHFKSLAMLVLCL